MEAVNDMGTAFATLHYGGPSNRQFASYWTHGPGQYTGNPLTKVCGLPEEGSCRVLEEAIKLIAIGEDSTVWKVHNRWLPFADMTWLRSRL